MDGITNDNTLTFTIAAESGSTVRVYANKSAPILFGTANETSLDSGIYTFTPTNPISDASYQFYATVADRAGNVTESAYFSTGSTTTITIDTTPPAIPVVTPLITNDTSPVLNGTAVLMAGESLAVTVNSVTYTTTSTPNPLVVTQVIGNNYSWSIQLPELPTNVTYGVIATITDAAGNTSSDNHNTDLVIDTTAPTITSFTSTTDDGSYKAGSSINITATASEALQAGSSITVTLGTGNPGATVLLTAITAGTSLSGNYIVGVGDTSNDLDVTSYALGTGPAAPKDIAGNSIISNTLPTNINSLAGSKSIVIDTTPPGTPTISSVTDNVGVGGVAATAVTVLNNGGTNDNTASLNITAEAGATVVVFSNGAYIGMATPNAVGSTSYSFTPSIFMPDGTNVLTVQATDAALNVSALSNEYVVTIDTAAPTAPTVNPLSSPGTYPVISGTALLSQGDVFAVTVSGTTYTYAENDPSLPAWTWSNDTWSLDFGKLSTPRSLTTGTYNVVATITDIAGNIATDTTTNELVVDNTPPTISRFTSNTLDGFYRAGAIIDITAIANENVRAGSQITVTLDTGDTVTLTATNAGTTFNGTYTVGVGDISADLNIISYTLGPVIPIDTIGNSMVSTTMPTGANNLSGNKGLIVNANTFASFATATQTVTEGTGNNVSMTYTINLDAPALPGQVLNWKIVGTGTNPATASDFAATSGTINFVGGERTATISLAVVGDTLNESAETFSVVLDSPGNGLFVNGPSATGTINDNDGNAQSLSAASNNVTIASGWVLGNAGNDTLNASSATTSVVLNGGTGSDRLTGGSADDQLLGAAGNDTLSGGNGNDILSGGTGTDSMNGGAGNDIFYFTAGDSGQTLTTRDVIADFSKGSDFINYVTNLFIGGHNAQGTAAQASINSTTGVATFAAGSGTNITDALADISARFNSDGTQQGEFALFQVNSTGNYYMMISDGIVGATNDVVVELIGVTSVNSISLVDGMLSITA